MKIKKYFPRTILLILVGITFLPAKSQVSIFTIEPTGNFTLEDLWNITITIPSTKQYKYFFLTIDVSEQKKGKIVFCKSNNFELKDGTTLINKNNYSFLKPIQTNYSSYGDLRNTLERGGTFPNGTYTINTNLYGFEQYSDQKGKIVLIADNVFNIEALEIQPPFLIYPNDNDTIEDRNPTFLWSTPFPVTQNQKVEYKITIVEINQNQTFYSAMKSNSPYFLQNQLSVAFLPYTSAAPEFILRRSYAWQVTAYIDGEKNAESDIWSFTYDKKKKLKKLYSPNGYLKVSNQNSASFITIKSDGLAFEYYEEYFDTNQLLRYSISTYDSKKKNTISITNLPPLNVSIGSNYYFIPFDDSEEGINLKNKVMYTLQIINSKGEKLYLNFMKTK